jgi:hypothetical protein
MDIKTLGMKIAKFGIIDQHTNACHMSNAIFGKGI